MIVGSSSIAHFEQICPHWFIALGMVFFAPRNNRDCFLYTHFFKDGVVSETCNREPPKPFQEHICGYPYYSQTALSRAHSKSDLEVQPSDQKLVCMHFEVKHAYFKELAKKIKNFKNIPYSLVLKNQEVVCPSTWLLKAGAWSVHCLAMTSPLEQVNIYLVEMWRMLKLASLVFSH